jgi:Xaa-Pro aminopeptidase
MHDASVAYSRLDALRNEHALDALILSSRAMRIYLSGYPFVHTPDREAFFLVHKHGISCVVSPLLQDELHKRLHHATYITVGSTQRLSFMDGLRMECDRLSIRQIGYESDNLLAQEYLALTSYGYVLKPLPIAQIRDQKTPEEIGRIRAACRITDRIYPDILRELHEGITEKRVVFLLEQMMRSNGCEPSFPSIIAFGKNAAIPHHIPDDTQLRKGDGVLMDFGLIYEDYCSDMSRCIFFGTPAQPQADAYMSLLKAQQHAITYLEDNSHQSSLPGKLVDQSARQYLTELKYPSYPHSLGHSIGIEVHDGFRLSPASDFTLTRGCVFSVEPGIYISGEYGLRIEDIVAWTDDGIEVLSQASKELTFLPV